MTHSFIKITNLQKIEESFEALILDIWGVLWDGIEPYAHAKDSLKKLKAKNVPIILLSNAPRRIHVVKKKLFDIGIHDNLYDEIISSGEICRNNFLNNKSTISKIGKYFYFIGQNEDKSITEGLQLEQVDDIKYADFLLVCGTRDFDDNLGVYKNEMKKALEFKLPFVCANPDKVVIRQNGNLLICAGQMAEYYKNNGGKIYSFGKPYPSAYEACIKYLEKLKPHIKKKEILIVGDSLETDILGANNINIPSLLIASGIHNKDLLIDKGYVSNDQIRKIFSDNASYPNFIMKQFIF